MAFKTMGNTKDQENQYSPFAQKSFVSLFSCNKINIYLFCYCLLLSRYISDEIHFIEWQQTSLTTKCKTRTNKKIAQTP